MEEEIDLKDIFIGLWKKRGVIILVTIVFALIGIIYSQISNDIPEVLNNVNETYIAKNTFKLGNKEKKVIAAGSETDDESEVLATSSAEATNVSYVSDGSITVDETSLELYSEILKSADTLNKINEKYNIDISIDDWKQLISISQVNETELLTIKFEYIDSEIAIGVVDDLTEILENYITNMYSSYKVYPITIVDSTKIDESEDAVSVLDNSSSIKIVGIVTIVGFVFACAIVVIIEFLKDNIKNQEHLEKNLETKNLATVSESDDYNSDVIKMLRINLENCKTLCLTTPKDSSGSNNIAVNLAKSFVELDKKVVLIDLDNKNIGLIKKYNNKGLADYLNSNDKFVEKYANESTLKNLTILTLGSNLENTTELLESAKMKEAIETLERLFDVVIIDSSNVLDSANAFAVSKVAKNVVLIVREREEKVLDVKQTKKNIEDIGGQIIGTILKRG